MTKENQPIKMDFTKDDIANVWQFTAARVATGMNAVQALAESINDVASIKTALKQKELETPLLGDRKDGERRNRIGIQETNTGWSLELPAEGWKKVQGNPARS